MRALLSLVCVVAAVFAAGPNARPDIYGLINTLYLKADLNLDGHITEAELASVFSGFDKNGDGTVTNAEFIELWVILTGQTQALANAYFHLGDVTDDAIIDAHDYPIIYKLFDLDHDGSVSATEFASKWEDIIRETPFAELFEISDTNTDEFLTQQEFSSYFSTFDTNGDGSVTQQEFTDGWSNADFVLASDTGVVFGDFDVNNDGNIDASDLQVIFTKYDASRDNKLSLQETIQLKNLLVCPRC